jgi:hypothetical protein
MSRRLLLALYVAVLTAGSIVSTPTHAHYPGPYRACVVTKYDTPLWWCPHYHCHVWIHRWRAFRLEWQSHGGAWVRNREVRGWIELDALRLADKRHCRGIF